MLANPHIFDNELSVLLFPNMMSWKKCKWSSKRLLATLSERQSPYTHDSQTGHQSDDKGHIEGTISGLGSYVEVVPCLQNDGFIEAKSTFSPSMHSERSPASGQDHRNIWCPILANRHILMPARSAPGTTTNAILKVTGVDTWHPKWWSYRNEINIFIWSRFSAPKHTKKALMHTKHAHVQNVRPYRAKLSLTAHQKCEHAKTAKLLDVNEDQGQKGPQVL